MASEEDPPVYNDDDLDDNDDNDIVSSPLNGAVHDDVVSASSSSDDDDIPIPSSVNAVTVAIPSSVAPPATTPLSAVTVALPDPKRSHSLSSSAAAADKKPIDDSRRLFQRLWTDEDEIELLQGFLDYTATRGATSSGHHHDTAAFYDQIKSKLQLDFNKNQLVEKLRRLKKKYRNVLGKMSSGKDFQFKSPHDQATFEISKKIWSNLSGNHRANVDLDDDDQNPNPNPSPNPSGGFMINLNTAVTPLADRAGGGFDPMRESLANSPAKLMSRKRPRAGPGPGPGVKMEDKFVRVNLGSSGDHGAVNNCNVSPASNSGNNNVGVGTVMQGLIEETVRSCLSPVLKDLAKSVRGPPGGNGGLARGGIVDDLVKNAAPLSFSGVGEGDAMDERWRKQQILELEVYSRRLELVQEQVRSTLEELRSKGGG